MSPIPTSILYGYVKDPQLNPIVAAPIKFRIMPSPQYNGEVVYDKADYTVLSDETGYFEVVLAAGLCINVTIPSCNYSGTGVMPQTGRLSLVELERQP